MITYSRPIPTLHGEAAQRFFEEISRESEKKVDMSEQIETARKILERSNM